YLTLSASGVKRLLSLSADFPSRLASAQRRSVVAHYREFSETGNSFLKKNDQALTYHPDKPKLTIYSSKKRKKR
ncbi:hypothetical protein, partial [Xenorhabdus littoralis]|uniref:hypothetical protein n=1 Tax=Xenorhabdus littoralis TaxID=2582835 RepID=UPI0029E8199B